MMTVHVQLHELELAATDQDPGLAGAPALALLNTSRGRVVDEGELAHTLPDGRRRFAAMDVFEQEPPEPALPLFSDSALCTPRLAGRTNEILIRMSDSAAGAVLDVLAGREPAQFVTPEVLCRFALRPRHPASDAAPGIR